jgi:putative effector of murein hydrolase
MMALLASGGLVALFALVRAGSGRLGHPAWANPVLVTALLCVAGLKLCGMTLGRFEGLAAPLLWWLGPMLVALGGMVDAARPLLRGRAVAALGAVVLGALVGLAVAGLGAHWLGLAPGLAAAVTAKTVSGPFIVAVLAGEGGPVALAAALSVLTGVVGAMTVLPMFDRLGVREPAARALALGVSAHLVGSEFASRRDPATGGLAVVGLVGVGLVAALVLKPLWHWMGG